VYRPGGSADKAQPALLPSRHAGGLLLGHRLHLPYLYLGLFFTSRHIYMS